ncbi:hypothetical protein MtrunA17_Chr1g0194331 [Medicago truncatula]|uniref:Auxilin-like protein n=1 Tax=Medicago truncatula TaxID=3880 RepID=A0A396JXH7_MEDTR|nr:hypothetical protein MtrunA17_Chr1g0194331 [Medicago truncatula]
MEVKFDMITRQKSLLGCLKATNSHDFLVAILMDGLCQHMSSVEYRTILRYRLMIPLFPVDDVCFVFRKVCLDTFVKHTVHCKELLGFKYKYDFVRDVIFFYIFRQVGVSVKKEVPMNFLTDPLDRRSIVKLADIMVCGWVGGKYANVDLTRVSPLVDLGVGSFMV